MSGFIFDAKAARAAIAARGPRVITAAVSAVLAVEGGAEVQEPQQPQQPQGASIPAGTVSADEIEERAAMAAGGVPGPYLDTWARLQCQRPFGASDQEWWQVIDDAGRFLDQWGSRAVEFGWTPGDLFDVPNETGKCGLAWFLLGDSVRSLEPDGAFMESGRVFDKLTHCTWKNPRQNGGAQ
jgi:hypothetical protein